MQTIPDTFFSAAPDWTLYIVPYFFVGGIAGGAYLLAALLHWRGAAGDERIIRLGYMVAAIGAIVSGVLLTFDLGRPLRFWHMLFQSERLPLPILKAWSPMSVGAWALLLFGLFAMLSALGALAVEGRLRWRLLRVFYEGRTGRSIAAAGSVFGLFIAGYTGVLLSVSNRPIWADTKFLGILFLFSAASTAAATLILFAQSRAGQGVRTATVEWLAWFDGWALLLELLALLLFLLSLGRVAVLWLSLWGVALLGLVVILGILLPLALHFRPTAFTERWRSRRLAAGAVLVLIGGLFLRLIVLGASESVHYSQGMPW
jgi:protein NrfD